MLSANSESFASYCSSWIPFVFCSTLIAVAETSKTMLNSSGETGHPCVVPDFRRNAFNFSPLRIMFAVGLSYIAFIMLRYVPSIPAFWRVFIINGCWILSKAFSASIEIIIWFLFFNLLLWYITLIDLQILKNPCIPGIKPTWSWCMIFLTCCWILFARILLRVFHLCSSVILEARIWSSEASPSLLSSRLCGKALLSGERASWPECP